MIGLLFFASTPVKAQSVWNGNTATGGGTGWNVNANWVGGSAPVSAATTNLVFDNRTGGGTLPTALAVGADRVVGLITFSNSNGALPTTLTINTNVSGTIARSLTVHTGITLANTNTTVSFGGANGPLSFVLGANNTFTTSTGSLLQIASGVTVSGGFGITTAGSGSVALNAQNTFTGGVVVGSGTALRLGIQASSVVSGGVLVSGQVGTGILELQNGSSLTSLSNGDRELQNSLRLNGAVTFGATSTFTGDLTFDSSSGTEAGQTLTAPATISLLGNTTVTTNVATSFLNVISGAFSLSKEGSGNLTVSGTNTFSGGVNIGSGTLRIGLSGSMGTSSGLVRLGRSGGGNASLISYLAGYTYPQSIEVVAGSGGILTIGNSSTFGSTSIFSGPLTLNDNLVMTSVAPVGFSVRFSGAISGAFGITKTGTGMVQWTNNNPSYSGTTTISEGVLQMGTIAGSTAGALGSGDVINNATLQISRTNSYVLGNAMSGSGAFVHSGSGTTTLSGTNTYLGMTTVSAGALLIDGDNSGATGAVSVAAGATLGGSGTIGGATTISGIHSPGSSPGIQTFLGDLTYAAGANINWELYGNTAAIGGRGTITGYDGINVGGALTFGPTTTFNLSFGTTAEGSMVDWSDAIWGMDQQWLVYSGATSLSGLPVLNVLDWTDAQGDLFSSIVGSFGLTSSGNDVYLNFTAIPEPSRAGLMLLGVLGVLMRRRRGMPI